MLVVLAHITDSHVCPAGRRTAVLKDKSVDLLRDIIDQVNTAGVDAALFGGDNIDNQGDGRHDLDTFLALSEKLPRWMCVVGNHEAVHARSGTGQISKEDFLRAVEGHGCGPDQTQFSSVVGNVRIIGIDTTLRGSPGGFVSLATMRFLQGELRRATEPHVVVLGHHLLSAPWAPYRLDAWDEEYLVKNRADAISLLAAYPQVRAYLCGHHHASRIQRIAGRGDSTGFYHILTPSTVAYPLGARRITFFDDAMMVEAIRPRIAHATDEAFEAVLGGRKAKRFGALGSSQSFAEYVAGRPSDSTCFLRYDAQHDANRPSRAKRRVAQDQANP